MLPGAAEGLQLTLKPLIVAMAWQCMPPALSTFCPGRGRGSWVLELMPYLEHLLIKDWRHGIGHDVILKGFRGQRNLAFQQLLSQLLQGPGSPVDLRVRCMTNQLLNNLSYN